MNQNIIEGKLKSHNKLALVGAIIGFASIVACFCGIYTARLSEQQEPEKAQTHIAAGLSMGSIGFAGMIASGVMLEVAETKEKKTPKVAPEKEMSN